MEIKSSVNKFWINFRYCSKPWNQVEIKQLQSMTTWRFCSNWKDSSKNKTSDNFYMRN